MAIRVARVRRTRLTFAHMVAKKGMRHEHGIVAMLDDIKKLGYYEVILTSYSELAFTPVQEEVNRWREMPTILETSPMNDSQSNGAAERVVLAVQEQVRVLKRALEQRLRAKAQGARPIVSWMIEHAADLLAKYQMGDDGKTPDGRPKGKRLKGGPLISARRGPLQIAQGSNEAQA